MTDIARFDLRTEGLGLPDMGTVEMATARSESRLCLCDLLACVEGRPAGAEAFPSCPAGACDRLNAGDRRACAAARHPDPVVRLAAVERLSDSDLSPFLDDDDRAVRELAYGRLIAWSRLHIARLLREDTGTRALRSLQSKEHAQ